MAIEALALIVGKDNVVDSVEALEAISSDLSFAPKIRPKSIVKVKTAGETHKLIEWAKETGTPLVPVSSGPPHFRGDTVPSAGGAVIMDLSGMNQIIRVDARNRVVMIEPGVTFDELIPVLAEEGIRLNLPLLPRATKSVIGSMLEREPVIMPHYQWDSQDPLTCIEIIFGTGDMFRTGSAAGPGTLEEQWEAKQAQVIPMGPGQSDLARVVQGAQGTLGIITWASVRCERMPLLQKPYLIGDNTPEKLIEFVYRLLWLKAVDECLIINSPNLATMLAKNSKEYNELKDVLPQWNLFYSISGYTYFPEDQVGYKTKQMTEAAQILGILPSTAVPGATAVEVHKTIAMPSAEPYYKLRQKGAFQDLFFLTTLDRANKFIVMMYDIAGKYGYPASDIGVYIQPMVQGSSCHVEFNLPYNPANAKEVTQIKNIYAKAAEMFLNSGAFYSRPYNMLSDITFRRDAETTASLRKIKKIFDPDNIMNSGKLCF